MQTDQTNKMPVNQQIDYKHARVGGFWLAAAQIISDILSPYLLPLYCTALCFWGTPMVLSPERPRFFAMGVVFCLSTALPFLFMALLLRTGRISDMAASIRRQRVRPFVFVLICNVITAIYLYYVNAPWWIPMFFIGSVAAVAIVLLISLRWKISAHAAGIGGVVGLSMWLCLTGLLLFNSMIWMSAVILMAGFVGSSRVALGRHTTMQVYAGWAVGFVSVFAALTIAAHILG